MPSDIFCSTSPEQKAGERLSLLLTQEAIKTIVEQGMGQRYRSDISKDLSAYVLSHPLNNDPKDWLLTMLSNDSYYRQTAMRIMEVREHIASDTFKWKDLPERLLSEVHEDNSELLTRAFPLVMPASLQSDVHEGELIPRRNAHADHIASGLEKQLEQTVDEDEESTGE